jgi:hypothetical protein
MCSQASVGEVDRCCCTASVSLPSHIDHRFNTDTMMVSPILQWTSFSQFDRVWEDCPDGASPSWEFLLASFVSSNPSSAVL